MTEQEARDAAKVLRGVLIGVTAAPLRTSSTGQWGVRRWTEENAIYTQVETMPADWQRELARS